MATATVTSYVTHTVTSAAASASSTNRSPPQGGIIEGGNPSVYDPKNPIIMFIIQAGIVIIACRLLHWPLSKLRQPRVIAEVIVGILLGPSVFGRIPGFTAAIFPAASIPNFTLVANLGLVLFLFLVGLEVDLRYLASNWRIAASVGLAGMAIPFGLGCAISYGLYHSFREDSGLKPISFGTYMLFIAIAMAITAFPVLCRILTELKLLSTPVGVIVLSAGVGNDVVGWILLALCVALVNAANGLTALYVLLTALAFTLFLTFIVRRAFMWVLTRTRSLEEGPTQPVVALTLLLCLASAFFTGVIGIHPIFGAFVAGLIMPHEGGFAIKTAEKIEDLVSTLFLPLYFALSGLSTNLGLLDSGLTWAYVIGVTACAFFGKMIGGTGAARLNGMVWRESFTIGALMSCKGLVELIVLNIGLNAKILSQRTFTIFVVMALVTTFATTPLTAALYPSWYQRKLEAWKRGEIDWDTGRPIGASEDSSTGDNVAIEKAEALRIRKILVYLRLDSMPGILTLTSLLGGANQHTYADPSTTDSAQRKGQSTSRHTRNDPTSRHISLHGLRLVHLTERESSVMKVADSSTSIFDPVVNTFRAFGSLNSVRTSGEVAIVPEAYFADTLASCASDVNASLILLPWTETGNISEYQTMSAEESRNRVDPARATTGPYANFMHEVLSTAAESTHVALFVNNRSASHVATTRTVNSRQLSRSFSGMSTNGNHEHGAADNYYPSGQRSHKIFLPYFGTADDRVAVRLVLQLVRNPRVSVLIVHYKLSDDELEDEYEWAQEQTQGSSGAAGSAKGPDVQHIPLHDRNATFLATMMATLSADARMRVHTEDALSTGKVGSDVAARAQAYFQTTLSNGIANLHGQEDFVVVGRNEGAISGRGTSKTINVPCLGTLGNAVLAANDFEASLLVIQAAAAAPHSDIVK